MPRQGNAPPMGLSRMDPSATAFDMPLTVYEEFQHIRAEAEVLGSPKPRKKRTSAGRSKYGAKKMEHMGHDDEDDEELHSRKRSD